MSRMEDVDIDIKNGDNMTFTVVTDWNIAGITGTDKFICNNLKDVAKRLKIKSFATTKMRVFWKHISGLHGVLKLKKGGTSL